MIVVDANVLAYYMIQGARTTQAQQLRDKDPRWILPDFWRIEFQSILCQYVKSKGMDAADADHLLSEALSLFSPQEAPISPTLALAEALRSGISAYDAHYIALAKQTGTACITEDRELQAKCPGVACSLRAFLDAEDNPPRVRERRAKYGRR